MNAEEYQVFYSAYLVAESLRKSDWCAGNEFAAIQLAVEKWIANIYCPCNPPMEVRRAIVRKFVHEQGKVEQVLHDLKEYGGYYGFAWAGMFVGVERDGSIHT